MGGNLRLWEQLCRTDPKATKPFQRAGFRGTQIDPVWRYQRMTEVFGPCGEGWGYELCRDPIISDGLVFVCVRVWWRGEDGERRHTGEQWGGDVLFKARREGPPVPNDEALKMATTDAVGKALVLLGLGADVHLGQFDDSKYRAESEAHFRAKANGAATQRGVREAETAKTGPQRSDGAAGPQPAPAAPPRFTPDGLLAVPMVDGPDGGVTADWKSWGKLFVEWLYTIEDLPELNAIVERHRHTINNLSFAAPKLHAALLDRIEKRRGAIVQAPGKENAA